MTESFDVCGPLPTGVTVLEASAGTGKTFTIAALAARYVAEGFPLEQILMVTFTRMATGELRERVRERLVSAEQGLERALAGAPPEDDAVVQLLATGSPTLVALRRERLAAALADFDSATIATTHGFCQEVLGGLGVLGDIESDTTFVEDISDLRDEVVDDLYLRRFHRHGVPAFGRGQALAIATAAIENPAAPIEPADAPADTIEAMRVRLADAARKELEARKRRMGVMTYDDLLTRLSDTLAGEGGAVAAARLRDRYRVVLVDEFQDTDPVQWQIMQTAFGDGEVTLVLIGDPKQAIYAFRGADVYAYIEAARTAGSEATLTTNWRSDQGLIDAYDALFGGAKLGHEGIVYREVRAAAANADTRLHGAPDPAPLRIRVVPRDDVGLTAKGYALLEPARRHVACDVAADIVSVLRSGASIDGEGSVRPGHIAVLVRTNRNASRVRDALEAVDVPAVINGAGSVFGTEPAREWLRVLEAIERPSYPPRARSAALTTILGWTTEQVAAADDDAWESVHRRLHHWARILRVKGVASLMEAITLEEGLPARVLGMVDGERRMTDLRHVGELLHAAATAEQMGATALTGWLRARVLEAARDNNDEERSRRLESDAEAVQVLTMHRSKGLEFPVVYYPDLWEPSWIPSDNNTPVTFHDADGTRTIDVGLGGPQWKAHVKQNLDEQRGEDLRLAYVALTRAKHQAVVWWAGSFSSRDSALSRLLFARDDEGSVATSGAAVPSDEAATARFRTLGDRVSVSPSLLGPTVSWPGDVVATSELSASSFDRTLDWWWRRTSFSDITAGTYEARVASEPEEAVVDDESAPHAPPASDDGADALRAVPSLLAEMGVGVEVGTLVHRVFESTDFAADDLDAELVAQVEAAQARRRVELGDPGLVVAGLRAAIETPLGPMAGGIALRDVARTDRLDELDFELPLVGGDDPSGPALTLAAIADVLRSHSESGDPLAGYAERLLDPRLRSSVRGYLAGSIDLVLRLDGERFAVVDYKTNWLALPGEELTAWHHRPAALSAEMTHSHYGLQALLYTVALHRYLRWRLPGYTPERNLAGVLYLFVRGMTGPDTPVVDGVPCGVFTWQPSAALVEALSDVLDQGESATAPSALTAGSAR
jgi:exodeoxyribonuclease V beta subunit